jgi:hypothetical protein
VNQSGSLIIDALRGLMFQYTFRVREESTGVRSDFAPGRPDFGLAPLVSAKLAEAMLEGSSPLVSGTQPNAEDL